MKTVIPLLTCILLSAASCSLFEDDIAFGHPHKYSQRYGSRSSVDQDSTAAGPARKLDTVVYISAVRIPEGYDWQRDTAYGAVDAELVLLRNFKESVRIPVGAHASAAADKHFIYGGHLFTEHHSSAGTSICRDGEELFALPGREELKGLLEHDGVMYTMTSPTGKEGFTLRADGSVVMRKNDGILFGGMLTPSYRPGGAIYPNGGKCCFCYSAEGTAYRVEDGVETIFRGSPLDSQDMKAIGGRDISAGANFRGLGLEDARIWPLTDGYAVSGTAKSTGFPVIYRSGDDSIQTMRLTDCQAIYVSDGYAFSAGCSRDGKVTLADDGGCREIDGSWYFFSPACATAGPSGPAIVLTPRGKGGKPVALYEGKTVTVDINGFLTGISIELEEKD